MKRDPQAERFGWVALTPSKPARVCRWCGRPNVVFRTDLVLCPSCDVLSDRPSKPTTEEEPEA